MFVTRAHARLGSLLKPHSLSPHCGGASVGLDPSCGPHQPDPDHHGHGTEPPPPLLMMEGRLDCDEAQIWQALQDLEAAEEYLDPSAAASSMALIYVKGLRAFFQVVLGEQVESGPDDIERGVGRAKGMGGGPSLTKPVPKPRP